ncbi:SDR family oxidoreductase [Streptomyces huiliensis]|uniref:SDR family oxidoreductase n=1 Tax=Streptomyces huiliensis TaxID=2876027 RepID=UPI001CBA89BC|nr:SDR family oxidoreductase [Streptomyces huiliensis]MBZ4322113.1 SDR family oxidoreductase [Streptomyces huiliensis]
MHIALTGATGFLGCRLLPRLLRRGAEVTVLARPRPRDARERLAEAFTRMAAPAPLLDALRHRVRVVEADVSLPRLGLPARRFQELADGVDAVWHSAGDIRLNADLASLRTTNVEGTRHVLEFAAAGRRCPRLHHVSTAFVAGGLRDGVAREREPTDTHGFENHYERSKYEGELLVRDWCRRYGRPALVLRPSILVSDLPPGPGLPPHPLQFLAEMARSGLEAAELAGLGLPAGAPPPVVRMPGRADGHLNLLPVEWAAEAMVLISERFPHRSPGVFHVVHPRDTPMAVLVRLFERFLPVRLDLRPDGVPDPTEAERVADFYPGFTPYLGHRRRFDDAAARRLLAGLPPPPDVDLAYLLSGTTPVTAGPAAAALGP